jgi:hypothetical protein
VSVFFTVTVAPLTAAPDESVTVPKIVPRKVWAFAAIAQKNSSVATHAIITARKAKVDFLAEFAFDKAHLPSLTAKRSLPDWLVFMLSPGGFFPALAPTRTKTPLDAKLAPVSAPTVTAAHGRVKQTEKTRGPILGHAGRIRPYLRKKASAV